MARCDSTYAERYACRADHEGRNPNAQPPAVMAVLLQLQLARSMTPPDRSRGRSVRHVIVTVPDYD